jgi:hypothetical protein
MRAVSSRDEILARSGRRFDHVEYLLTTTERRHSHDGIAWLMRGHSCGAQVRAARPSERLEELGQVAFFLRRYGKLAAEIV